MLREWRGKNFDEREREKKCGKKPQNYNNLTKFMNFLVIFPG